MSTPELRTVAFVDDDADVLAANAQSLALAGLDVRPCSSAEEALRFMSADFPGVVVSDLRMPRLDGLELFQRLRRMDPDLPVILITGHGDIGEAVEAMRNGAYDFIAKPYPAERLVASVRHALEKRTLVLDNRMLRRRAAESDDDIPLLGETTSMQTLRATIRQVADADVDVLIEGETGTGKEVAARALRAAGRRRNGPFVTVDCAVMPEGLIESELFGHEIGAFAGATRRRIGRIEASHRGTLFLDNIDSTHPELQSRLLRVLQDREVSRVGSTQPRPADFRTIAASNSDLGQRVTEGRFRSDLFYRLNVIRLRIPPLRERRSDIPLLFRRFLVDAAKRFNLARPADVSDTVRRHLLEHDWPGNVRELQHFAERVALNFETGAATNPDQNHGTLPQRIERFEASVIRETLAMTDGSVPATVEALGIPRKTFYDKVTRYGIRLSDYRDADKR